MADSLEDVFRRVSDANIGAPKVAQPEPALQNPKPRWQRVLATTLPGIATDIASAPTGLYALADAGVGWAGNKMGFPNAGLPGGEGAMEITKSIQDAGNAFNNKLAGETYGEEPYCRVILCKSVLNGHVYCLVLVYLLL